MDLVMGVIRCGATAALERFGAEIERNDNGEVISVSAKPNITDAGLEHLERLTNLRSLGLSYTQVTAVRLAELKKALPNCKVIGK